MSAAGIAQYVARALGFAGAVCGIRMVIRLARWAATGGRPDWRRELRLLLQTGYLAALTEIIALRGGPGAVRALLKKLDLTLTLGDLGITEADIPWMTENCMKVSAASVANNPVVLTQEQIAELYSKAL